MFVAGCLLYYILSGGGHPFDNDFVKVGNNERDLSALTNAPTALHLISRMIAAVEGERPTAAQCVADPLFWAASKSVVLCALLREALGTSQGHPDTLHLQNLQQELEQSISGAHGDFSSEANGWPGAIPNPPQGQWEKPPKLFPASPLFSLLVFIRNAQQHIPQLIKKGIFSNEAQMHRFFAVDHFPWLASVLHAFIQGPLMQAVKNDAITEGTRAALTDIIRCAEREGHQSWSNFASNSTSPHGE